MPRDESSQPFYLIVTDHDRGVFAVEGPMTDDRHWKEAGTRVSRLLTAAQFHRLSAALLDRIDRRG
jgi:hypothetical protein